MGEFKALTHLELKQCLSDIQPLVGGGGFAFTRMDCSNRELTVLGNKIDKYEHLRHISISGNSFQNIQAITQLPHTLEIDASKNQVEEFDMSEAKLPWCQRLNLSENKLTALPPLLTLGRLRFLYLGGQDPGISTLKDFGGHPALEELNLRGNKLQTLEGLGSLPKLKELVLAENEIGPSLVGLDAPALEVLDVEKNQLETLEGLGGAAGAAGAPACRELNVRGNQLQTPAPPADAEDGQEHDLTPVELVRLGEELPRLESLLISGNPLADNLSEGLKTEVLIYAPQVLRIEEEEVTSDDRQLARETQATRERERREQEEAKEQARLEAEAKAKEEAEAAAAAAAEGEAEGGG